MSSSENFKSNYLYHFIPNTTKLAHFSFDLSFQTKSSWALFAKPVSLLLRTKKARDVVDGDPSFLVFFSSVLIKTALLSRSSAPLKFETYDLENCEFANKPDTRFSHEVRRIFPGMIERSLMSESFWRAREVLWLIIFSNCYEKARRILIKFNITQV